MRSYDDPVVTFSCSGKQGVSLYLPFPAQQKDTVATGDFKQWIVRNIYNCMRFAEEQGFGVNPMEDIILVTGRHLAKSWIRTIFSESRGCAGVSFAARVSGNSAVHLEERNASGAHLVFGPNGKVGFCITFKGQTVLVNESDTTHTRIYQRINVFSFEVTTSSACWRVRQCFVDWQDQSSAC